MEIDKKLRDDFRRLLREYGITTPETDPLLAVLFRSLAAQVEAVYQQATDIIPRAVLDELIAGLGLPERGAQAAQSVTCYCIKPGNGEYCENAHWRRNWVSTTWPFPRQAWEQTLPAA
jgi:hypothetical protein